MNPHGPMFGASLTTPSVTCMNVHKHPLQLKGRPQFKCDHCKVIKNGEYAYRCDGCDFDLCELCWKNILIGAPMHPMGMAPHGAMPMHGVPGPFGPH